MNFTVLLIGGGSASGKTELAKLLSEHYKVNRVLADDIRIAMEAVVTRDNPIYNFQEDEGITEEERQNYPSYTKQQVSQEVCKGLENIVHHHLAVRDPLIIEGDDVLPDFAKARQDYATQGVKSVFLYLEDRGLIKNNLLSRNRFLDLDNIDAAVEDLLSNNMAIKQEAGSLGLLTVQADPYETLLERVTEVLK